MGDAGSSSNAVAQGLRRSSQVESRREVEGLITFSVISFYAISINWKHGCCGLSGSSEEDTQQIRAKAARVDGEADGRKGAASSDHQHRGKEHGTVMLS